MRGWGTRLGPGLLPLDGVGAVYGRCVWVLSAVWDAAKDTRGLGWREFAETSGWLADQWQRGAVRPGMESLAAGRGRG